MWDAQSPSSNENQQIPKLKKGDNTIRPRVPSHESIGFAYFYEVCYFTLPDYITYIDVTMQNEKGEILSTCVYADDPRWSISLLPGEYQISCDSDEGSYFEGSVWIN